MFYFEVSGIDKMEVNKRVADHEKRGWQVHREFVRTEGDRVIPKRRGRKLFKGEKAFVTPDLYIKYVVVMKKEDEREEEKQK